MPSALRSQEQRGLNQVKGVMGQAGTIQVRGTASLKILKSEGTWNFVEAGGKFTWLGAESKGQLL